MLWKCGNFEFDTRFPVIMGIINATPDSFSDGGKNFKSDTALVNARKLIDEGASIIDVGGESTRPGSSPIDAQEEWRRIEKIVVELAKEGVCVSVDTRHSNVAKRAIKAGASIINDISGFQNPEMIRVVRDANCGLVVMHMRGTPQDMQEHCDYEDVVSEVKDFLSERVESLSVLGIDKSRICVDPGPGFAKNAQQTLDIMRNIHEFRHIGCPVMAAPSRKSYLSTLTSESLDCEAKDALTAKECLKAAELGASILRVHNAKVVADALKDLKPYAILSLGANVALVQSSGKDIKDSLIAQLNLAIQELLFLPDSQLIDVSNFYSSKPAYLENQADFVNCAVLLRTGIAPKELLGYLHAIENSLRRVREVENGPRTLDIDIVDYQLYVCESELLTLPHVGATQRDFVVKPILDILPGHILADGTRIDSIPESDRVGAAQKIEGKKCSI